MVENTQLRTLLLVAILLFGLIVQFCVTAISPGLPVDISFALNLVISFLLIVIGNFMSKLRHNFWMGIRTPWTSSRDNVPQKMVHWHQRDGHFHQSRFVGLCRAAQGGIAPQAGEGMPLLSILCPLWLP